MPDSINDYLSNFNMFGYACFLQPTDRLTLDDFRVCIDGKSSGAVRVSVGLASNIG